MLHYSLTVDILTAVLFLCDTVITTTDSSVYVWDELYFGQVQDCDYVIRNDQMMEGDLYRIRSDRWSGGQHSKEQGTRTPAECTATLWSGDRFLQAEVVTWHKCDKPILLAIYDTCDGQRKKPLLLMNCSSGSAPVSIRSSGSCLTVYHYRGDTSHGYFFTVELQALQEILPFSVGGVAGIIVGSIVLIMLIIKFVCVVTGYESRLPSLNLNDNDRQQIMMEARRQVALHRQLTARERVTEGSRSSLRSALSGPSYLPINNAISLHSLPTDVHCHDNNDSQYHNNDSPKLKCYSSYKASVF